MSDDQPDANMMHIDAYLERIGYTGSTSPSLDTLRALHVCHMQSTPFENLDIHLKRPIVLDEQRLYNKIVGERRGGFCYELNAAFGWLLRALGFDVTYVSARVWSGQTFSLPFDHMALIVSLDEPWLADVGFGDSSLLPLRFVPEVAQPDGRRGYRLTAGGDAWIMQEQNMQTGEFENGYTFATEPHQLDDYAVMCHYQQTSPDSMFTRKLICSRATERGRISLSGSRLIVTRDGSREEHLLSTADEIRVVLEQRFGVALSTQAVQAMFNSARVELDS